MACMDRYGYPFFFFFPWCGLDPPTVIMNERVAASWTGWVDGAHNMTFTYYCPELALCVHRGLLKPWSWEPLR